MRKPRFSHEAFGYTKHGRRWNLGQWTPGIANEFFYHFPDINRVDPTRPVVLMYRSSTEEQVRRRRHDQGWMQAVKELGRYGVKLGGRLKAVFEGVESASVYKYRPLLERAIECAKELNAILVVGMTRDRALRGCEYNGRNATEEEPTIAEYMELMRMVGDVPIATLLLPDTPVKPVATERGLPPSRPKRELTQRQILDAVLKLMKTLPY